jgi:hypothetical protein
MKRYGVAMVMAAALGGCAASPDGEQTSLPLSEAWSEAVCDRLYCGRNIRTGGMVSEEQWRAFLAEEVTPRFPAGLTVWSADGQWRDDQGKVVREPSFVLEVVHPDNAASEAALGAIADAYCARFNQDAVLRVRDQTRAKLELR